jgi:DNA-binding PadR family transcriptional regulator
MNEFLPGNAETAILGLLSEGAKHPYQIEKDVEFRSMRTWTDLSMSSIYKLLNRLELDALVNSKTEQTEGNRLRKVYELTPKGESSLMKSLEELLSSHVVAKNPFDLGIYFSDYLPEDVLFSALDEYHERLLDAIQCYTELEEYLKSQGCPKGPVALATRTKMMLEGELKWLEEHIKMLKG